MSRLADHIHHVADRDVSLLLRRDRTQRRLLLAAYREGLDAGVRQLSAVRDLLTELPDTKRQRRQREDVERRLAELAEGLRRVGAEADLCEDTDRHRREEVR